MLAPIRLNDLDAVRRAVMPCLHRTPTILSHTLSSLVGCRVHLKQELFQKTGSYKPRGMIWALRQRPRHQLERGVITFSAGNAAQGLAYAAGLLDVPATVVMPATASPTKAEATRGYGAEVILHGSPTECLSYCQAVAAERDLAFISSYDDADLMTGHATMGLEIIEDVPDAKAIFVGMGGGGMAGGLAIAMRALAHPAMLVGVEPTGAPAMHRSLEAGQAIRLDQITTIADGLAAPNAGALCFEQVRDRFQSVILVEDEAIIEAMTLLMTRCKLFAEPAGAAALAGLLSRRGTFAPDNDVVCVVSGGNLDIARLKVLF